MAGGVFPLHTTHWYGSPLGGLEIPKTSTTLATDGFEGVAWRVTLTALAVFGSGWCIGSGWLVGSYWEAFRVCFLGMFTWPATKLGLLSARCLRSVSGAFASIFVNSPQNYSADTKNAVQTPHANCSRGGPGVRGRQPPHKTKLT